MPVILLQHVETPQHLQELEAEEDVVLGQQEEMSCPKTLGPWPARFHGSHCHPLIPK